MSYVEDSLSSGEQVLLGPIERTLWEYFPWGLLLLTIPFIWLRRFSVEYAITNLRMVTKHGLVGRETHELRLDAIESVQVQQSLWGRMFDYGTLIATGRGNQVLRMENIRAPLEAKKRLESTRP
jgi:uncharacterized membrane protein YdbT with pleckstrin-like domain